jgi:hypothetical protein
MTSSGSSDESHGDVPEADRFVVYQDTCIEDLDRLNSERENSFADNHWSRHTLAKVTTTVLRQAFQQALARFGGADPLAKSWLNNLVIVAVDQLVGIVFGRRDPSPWLYAQLPAGESAPILDLQFCRRSRCESLVDVSVFGGARDPYQTLITAECESKSTYPINEDSTSDCCDYLWDCWKLLQVYSPLRVFVARISSLKRLHLLEQRISQLVHDYSDSLHRGDRVFSLIVPQSLHDRPRARIAGWQKLGDGSAGQLVELPPTNW